MERKVDISVGEFYHIYNRGVEKRDIFIDSDDRERFLRLLYLSNSAKPFLFRDVKNLPYSSIVRGGQRTAIGAYCLMPNHFHLLVKETDEGGISAFMEKLTTGYSMYFNGKNKRVGSLFQNRFQVRHADHDEYLKYLFAYIHLNPVKIIDPQWKKNGISNKKEAEKFLAGYRYSSYRDYMGIAREESDILDRAEFPEYFEQPNDFKTFINDWLAFQEDEEIWIADEKQ
ncbi:MAG: transposase [Candidatus Paceibacterota bacterium]|jgi:putative transposase